jgi:hypothetical protein
MAAIILKYSEFVPIEFASEAGKDKNRHHFSMVSAAGSHVNTFPIVNTFPFYTR